MPTTPAAVTAVRHAATGSHNTVLGAIVLGSLLYLLFHRRHYRKRRAAGDSWWISLRGPWGSRIGRRF